MEVHVVLHLDGGKITAIEQKLSTLIRKVDIMSDNLQAKIDALTSEVAETGTVVQSAVALIDGISARVAEAVEKALAAGVPQESLTALTDLTNQLDADNKKLADAVAANTQASEEQPQS